MVSAEATCEQPGTHRFANRTHSLNLKTGFARKPFDRVPGKKVTMIGNELPPSRSKQTEPDTSNVWSLEDEPSVSSQKPMRLGKHRSRAENMFNRMIHRNNIERSTVDLDLRDGPGNAIQTSASCDIATRTFGFDSQSIKVSVCCGKQLTGR
jgi:hypothetical protein